MKDVLAFHFSGRRDYASVDLLLGGPPPLSSRVGPHYATTMFNRLLSRICGLFPALEAGLTCETGLFP